MDIAERMRDKVTRDNWIQDCMFNYLDTPALSACLVGHYILLSGGDVLSGIATPYILRLHEVIGEQYPEAVDAWLKDYYPSPVDLIFFFNDKIATFEDIQVVLEKAAA